MITYSGRQLSNYISDLKQLAMSQTKLDKVYERDFVADIRKYCFGGKSPFVYIVCGLRATGKTFGLLQAVENPDDTVYIQAQLGEDMDGQDYIEFLKTVKEKNIIIDEYSWIKDNHDLSYYLWTLVENGKRIAITGTHSLTLSYLEDAELVHRTDCINVNLFSYEEYCRIYQKDYTKTSCVEFLKTGGLFKSHAVENYQSMDLFIKEAVIDDLSRFINLPAEEAKAIVYDIMYLAVCDSNETKIKYPQMRKENQAYRDMLIAFGVNPEIKINPVKLDVVAGILEKANFIVRTHNFCNKDEFRLHLVNPSFAYQMACAVFNEKSADEKLGKAFEAYMVSYMTTCVREVDAIRYIDMGQLYGEPELELVIVNPDDHLAYLFDSKLREAASLPESSSLVSDKLENALGCLSVGGRYVVGNSPIEKCGERNGKKIIFTRLDCETLQNYRDFDDVYNKLKNGVGNGDDEQSHKSKYDRLNDD